MGTRRDSEYERVFNRLKGSLGTGLAIFCICAVADLPYFPEAGAVSWKDYAGKLGSAAQDGDGTERLGFASGETDAALAVSGGMTQKERWERTWGEGDSDKPYTTAQYKRLDVLYRLMTGQLAEMGSLTKNQEDTARFCAVCALQREELIAKGGKDNVGMAKTLDALIRSNLADCALRASDIAQTQGQRPDAFVDALKNRWGLTVEMTKDDVLQAFYRWCRERSYPQTVDAEEKAMLAILQTIQRNSDLPLDTELPQGLKLQEFGFEFSNEADEDELRAFDYLGLSREKGKD